jgi:hypothetical protein
MREEIKGYKRHGDGSPFSKSVRDGFLFGMDGRISCVVFGLAGVRSLDGEQEGAILALCLGNLNYGDTLMRRFVSLWAASLGLASLLGVQSVVHGQAAPPNAFNFQGRLATPSGNPIPDGSYTIRFRFYDSAADGIVLFEKTVAAVQVKNGTFAVTLDAVGETVFNGNTWLGIQIGSDAELEPRTQIVSVPYAIKSSLALTVPDASITNAKLAGSITADKLANGALNGTAWLLSGNSGVTDGFLGTTDGNPLVLRVNNLERMRLLSNGNVGIDAASPTAKFQVGSGSDFSNITTVGIVQRPFDTVALSLRQGVSPPRNTVIQFITGNLGNYIEHDRVTGNLLLGTNGFGGNSTMTIASGRVGIGTTSPVDTLTVVGSGTAISAIDNNIRTRLFSANITGSGYVGTSSPHDFIVRTSDVDRAYFTSDGRLGVANRPFTNSRMRTDAAGLEFALSVVGNAVGDGWLMRSDARLKEHIATVPDALSTVLGLRGVTYDYKQGIPNAVTGLQGKQYGFLAQEVEQIVPHLVKQGDNGYKAVNYIGMIPITVEAIKTQQSEIAFLRKHNDIIMRENDAIRKENAAIREENAAIKATLDEVLKRLEAMEKR